MKTAAKILKNMAILVGILLAGFYLCLHIQRIFENNELIPTIFALCVFLIAVFTDGYFYGVLASVCSVLAVNYAFTFPYFRINFTIPQNMVSAVIMIAITLITCGITNKIKYQEQIKEESEKEKMRANLLRAVSHDLRTPLTTIYGASSALLESKDEFTKEQKDQMLEGIRQDSEWLYRMVENLLSITRLDGDNVKILKTPIALDELLDSVLVRFQKRYGTQEVQLFIPDELIVIPMDAILMEQVLINLLENAVQHAKGMHELSLRVTVEEKKAVFEIWDDGCGIPEEKLKHIFNGNSPSKEVSADCKKSNWGIGLSVCQTIVKAHGGKIVAGNRKDGGTFFKFALDMEDLTDEQ